MSSQKNDNLPNVPETGPIEPLVQCGVLYLGTGPTSPGLRALDSIQEPFSHRYPVDGTNTVRGIDAVLSVYDNGIQLAFTRQPHAIVFFPIASLIYCASIRFSTVANDLTSLVDWRFIPLDQLNDGQDDNKHPPLFCAVFHRTHIIPGDECHCFITKNAEASLALVQNITQIYSDLPRGIIMSRSPIFYQLDRFGRKLSEINGVIYLTPANEDQSSRRTKHTHASKSTASSIQDYLSDPSLDGFFYRTNASSIEQWQLWDDDDHYGSRPRPPASPFGLHEGLYHDDVTQDIQRYLRRMEEEDETCSTCPDSKSKSSSESISSYSSSGTDSRKDESSDNADQFDRTLKNYQVSSFEPEPIRRRNQGISSAPIIIEKKIPALPVLQPHFPKARSKRKEFRPQAVETNVDYVPSTNPFSISYQINERGEKITKDGNRLVFMDVVRPTMNHPEKELPIYPTKKSNRRRSTHIPVLDLQNIEDFFQETRKQRRRQSIHLDQSQTFNPTPTEKRSLTTTDLFRTIDQHSIHSSLSTGKRSSHNRSSASHQPSISARSHRSEKSTHSFIEKKAYPTPPALTNEQVNQYVSNIYGAAGSIRSSSRSTSRQPVCASAASSIKGVNHQTPIIAGPPVSYPSYLAHLRYVRTGMNPNTLQQPSQNAYY